MLLKPYYQDESTLVINGDSLSALSGIADNSIDSICTDPPYALTELGDNVIEAISQWSRGDRGFVPVEGKSGFLDMEWDKFVPPPSLWDECYRVLKPGGYLLAFAGSRTQDIMGTSIRFSGFRIKDGIAWVQSSGFPKSQNVSRDIKKVSGELSEAHSGLGTGLKPSFEPIIVAQKPISETNIAANVLLHGTGALNIDKTRVGTLERDEFGEPLGRWTPNFALGHSEGCAEAGEEVDVFVRNRTEQWSGFGQLERPKYHSTKYSLRTKLYDCVPTCPVRILSEDSGTLSRGLSTSKFFPAFMYHKKATKKEKPISNGSRHVSVKPLELMSWLVRLVTPVGGVVLDPFLGSGTTVEAARLNGLSVIGIEREEEYMEFVMQRINRSSPS